MRFHDSALFIFGAPEHLTTTIKLTRYRSVCDTMQTQRYNVMEEGAKNTISYKILRRVHHLGWRREFEFRKITSKHTLTLALTLITVKHVTIYEYTQRFYTSEI